MRGVARFRQQYQDLDRLFWNRYYGTSDIDTTGMMVPSYPEKPRERAAALI